ncbi:MAG TPA: 16S rRNA (cytosine(1402)-N(4))-methyltransferase [Firmicutes bacterium]|nr:16S rRNA (cytosine(1402)-N(4))-methyltransferase [Bacillota bacterium]
MTKHVSVLLNEAINNLAIKSDGVYIDLTLGRGGHSSEILKRLINGKLYAFDKDQEAIDESRNRLANISNHFEIIHDDFKNFRKDLDERKVSYVDGLLVDLGVSSPQFDENERGFSYRSNARLDMRMDQRQNLDAYKVVNDYSLQDLTRIFREYGEEKYAYQIAKEIVKHRENSPIETTFDLVDIVKKVKPQKELNKKGHPAKQIFQAIRIEVNDELGALKTMITDAIKSLNVGGRLVIISFHSLEDRIVKNAFNEVSKIEGNRHNVFFIPTIEDEPKYKQIGKLITPSEEEMEINPRSKSAKMRVLERIRL